MDICDQASLVVTRCLDRAGFSDLDLLGPAPPPPPSPAGDSSQFDQTGLREILSPGETWGGIILEIVLENNSKQECEQRKPSFDPHWIIFEHLHVFSSNSK